MREVESRRSAVRQHPFVSRHVERHAQLADMEPEAGG
jgi:hypothetical protein